MTTPLALATILLSSSPAGPLPEQAPPQQAVAMEDASQPAPEAYPERTPAFKPLELGVQFGGMRILDNPVASSSLYLGARAAYRLPYQLVAGVVGQYDDFSSRTSTGSDFSFWATRAELGYELSQSETLSVLPYAQLGYASSNALLCPEQRECTRTLSDGSVGAVGFRFAGLGDSYFSGFEINYQFGHVDTLYFGVSGGFRL